MFLHMPSSCLHLLGFESGFGHVCEGEWETWFKPFHHCLGYIVLPKCKLQHQCHIIALVLKTFFCLTLYNALFVFLCFMCFLFVCFFFFLSSFGLSLVFAYLPASHLLCLSYWLPLYDPCFLCWSAGLFCFKWSSSLRNTLKSVCTMYC